MTKKPQQITENHHSHQNEETPYKNIGLGFPDISIKIIEWYMECKFDDLW